MWLREIRRLVAPNASLEPPAVRQQSRYVLAEGTFATYAFSRRPLSCAFRPVHMAVPEGALRVDFDPFAAPFGPAGYAICASLVIPGDHNRVTGSTEPPERLGDPPLEP